MKLTDIKNGNLSAEWAEKGYELPKFDVEAVKADLAGKKAVKLIVDSAVPVEEKKPAKKTAKKAKKTDDEAEEAPAEETEEETKE